MGKNKVLVKVSNLIYLFSQVNTEGKYVVSIDSSINIEVYIIRSLIIKDCKPNTRVALKSDSYILHKILPTNVDPLVSLMKVEKVPDSTYDMCGGLE